MIQTQENDKKPHFGPDLGMLGLNSGREFLFSSKIWLRQSLDQISCTIEKINDPFLRKLSDGRTDGRVISQEAVRLTSRVQKLITPDTIKLDTLFFYMHKAYKHT